ncbi:hypothetical protein vBEfaSAL2_32 [Enterococcus phage vB_EfaS_AL2]|uniref:Uncharacterized protein n=1 Tax=Enterococcus phage vB_EfaS_AL2 TaxID=2175688 RepID=A0A2S1PFD2_9CAUD|nr:hypothetical protein FDJ52_gp32 [Enterococcus phage vB_EfaS_AL2]AWH15270.1 hypothetical protein vBEfaSAL2_32 [Enterococcus phage vB_EfaS_AL2]
METEKSINLTQTDFLNIIDMMNNYIIKVGYDNVGEPFKETIKKIIEADENFYE